MAESIFSLAHVYLQSGHLNPPPTIITRLPDNRSPANHSYRPDCLKRDDILHFNSNCTGLPKNIIISHEYGLKKHPFLTDVRPFKHDLLVPDFISITPYAQIKTGGQFALDIRLPG